MRGDDPATRDDAIAAYAYLCARAARKFIRPGLERADLQQIAAIGLIKAYDRYDDTLSTPFEAFAWLFVVGELMHYVRDQERMVRPPRKLRELERRCSLAQEALVTELQREPTKLELAARLRIDVKMVAEVMRCREGAVPESLDAGVSSNCRLGTYMMDEQSALLSEAVAPLGEVERAVILALYAGGYTQSEVAAQLGYSRRHISRLHRAALRKLRPFCQKA